MGQSGGPKGMAAPRGQADKSGMVAFYPRQLLRVPTHLGFALLGLVAFGPPGVAIAQVLAQVVPAQYDVTVRAGDPVSRPLFLYNLGDETVDVRLRLADLLIDERGRLDLLPAGTLAPSLAGVVTLEPEHLTLRAGERGFVRLRMRMPAHGPATRYGIVLSRITAVRPPDFASVEASTGELGTTLYLTRAGPGSIRAELSAIEAAPQRDGSMSIDVRVRNRCERHVFASGEVSLADTSGVMLAHGRLETGVILPGAARVFTWSGDGPLAAGRYTVTTTIDVGEPELLVGQTQIVVRPRGPRAAAE